MTIVILAAFLVFFFLQDGDRAWVWIFQAASDQKRERITEAGDDALWRVGGYLRGTTILSGVIALTDYVFMVVLGVRSRSRSPCWRSSAATSPTSAGSSPPSSSWSSPMPPWGPARSSRCSC